MDRNWPDYLKVGDEIEFVFSDRCISPEYQPGVVFTVKRADQDRVTIYSEEGWFGFWDHYWLLKEFKPVGKRDRRLKGVARFLKDKDL